MKPKGNTKRVASPNFWGIYEKGVPSELKDMVYCQYLSRKVLYVYCDTSASKSSREMSVACTYVQNASIVVKQQLVYPPIDCIQKNIFGEIKAVIFGLTHFHKHLSEQSNRVVFYSDVNYIERIICSEIALKKNTSLKKLQDELICVYRKAKEDNPNLFLEIKYLPLVQKKHNPFANSSHNAAKRLLNRK